MEETMKISTEDIRIYAKALRLSNLRNNCGDIIHKAQIDKPSYMDFIMNILKAETASRQQNDLVRRMRQAKLPRNCDLDRFDFNHSAGVTKPQLKQLRELVWLDQMYNLIFMGPAGTGKTFMAAGLVRDAVMRGYRAQFLTMDGLINILRMKLSDEELRTLMNYRNILNYFYELWLKKTDNQYAEMERHVAAEMKKLFSDTGKNTERMVA